MLWRTFEGQLTLGDLALFYQAFTQGQGLLRSLLGNVGRIYENVLFLGNLFEFLDMQPQIVDPPHPKPAPTTLQEGIRFRQVTFSYPGSERKVLEDFNFDIPAGKVVAIVGANGAGKTTLVKLLCRLYDPQSGSIQLDGTDLCELRVKQVRRLITVLFQFPAPYFTSAAENIRLGDLAAAPDRGAIESAARSAGAHEFITRLPRGYDTPLGKWFAGGAELSGGEWQRLALARAFLRRAQIMILDEPTSFMDSWAEVDWFDRFRELAVGRTAIFITHRLLIAKRADIIHVMDKGRIVESGSHDELLAQGGRYAQSWVAQVQAGTLSQNKPKDEPVRTTQALPAALFAIDTHVPDQVDSPSRID
jgi:ATP-binding cassette subfamily B protein